jgi:hypothetical protein
MQRLIVVAVTHVLTFGFSLWDSYAAETPMDCGPEPTEKVLAYGEPFSCSFDTLGDLDVFRFTGVVGEKAIIRATRTSGVGGSPCIELFGPDQALIDSQCGNPVTLEPTLTQAGTYTLRLGSDLATLLFDYVLLLERLAPTSPTNIPAKYGDIHNGTVDFRGDIDFISFLGAVGDKPTIRATRTSGVGGSPCIELFGPDQALIDSQCGNPVTLEPTLTQAGTYTLRLGSDLATLLFDYVLELQCLFGPCAPILPPPPLPAVDHYKCYTVRGQNVEETVSLEDQFEQETSVSVSTPRFLCNPVSPYGEPIKNSEVSLTCYRTRSAEGQGKFEPRAVVVGNQFDGQQTLKVRDRAHLVCVPSSETIVP